jgi:EmrB/QacA subfamily drug resistance transporter
MSTPSRPWTLAITAIAFVMVTLDALVVVTALPAIHRELGADLAQLEWTVNAFSLTFAAFIITAAALGDRFGRRRVFVIGLAVFTIASAACALAPTAGALVAARAVQGIGAAMIMPLSLTLLVAAFPPERRGAVIGLWGALGGLGVAGGPLVGGAVTQGLDWHWIFWINVPIGIVAIALSQLRLLESRGPATRLDPVAVGLVGAGATGVVWGLIRAGEIGWGAAEALAGVAAGAALLVAFVGWEARASEPMLPLRLFGSRAFFAAIVTSFLLTGSLFAGAFLGSQFFQLGLGYSPLETGLRILPWTATPLFISPIGGVLSDRIGRRPVLVIGLALQAAGFLWLASVASTATAYLLMIVPLLVAGVGISLALPAAATAVVSAVSPGDVGKASGVNGTMQRFGSSFAVALAAAVFAANGTLASPAAFVAGFRPALIVVAGLALLGALTAVGVDGPRRVASARPAIDGPTPAASTAATNESIG